MAYPTQPNAASKGLAIARLRVTQSRARAALGTYDANQNELGASDPNDTLGVLPAVVAAAIPSVKTLAQKALNSVLGIFDPGKRRDANRQARAVMWGDIAVAGSITAARRVLGGQTLVYTEKEKQYYRDQWKRLQSTEKRLADQAVTLGGLGIPEPGSDQEPARISDEDMQSLQREIDAYRTGGTTTATATTPVAPARAGMGWLLGLGIAGAIAAKLFRRK